MAKARIFERPSSLTSHIPFRKKSMVFVIIIFRPPLLMFHIRTEQSSKKTVWKAGCRERGKEKTLKIEEGFRTRG